jgi:uncharacterized protein with PIN domain
LRLLCDEMLRGLGRWLRAAGYDTLIARSGTADADLLAFARAERRILLTCDRALARLAGDDPEVVTLATEALDPAAHELGARLGIDWLAAPFSRCLLDNAALRPASPLQAASVPAPAREGDGPLLACPECGRVYWPGSHVRRMRARLERWQRL